MAARANLGGFVRMAQQAIPHMLEQGGGHIVQLTTRLVDHANPNIPVVGRVRTDRSGKRP